MMPAQAPKILSPAAPPVQCTTSCGQWGVSYIVQHPCLLLKILGNTGTYFFIEILLFQQLCTLQDIGNGIQIVFHFYHPSSLKQNLNFNKDP